MDRRSLLQLLAGGAAASLLFDKSLAQAAAGGSIVAPIALRAQRVVLSCNFAGKGPHDFALDTGAIISLIRGDFARSMGFAGRGKVNLGVGGQRGQYDIVEARDVVIGGAIRQPSLQFAITDEVNFGAGIVGSLGAGILTAIDSELDFGAGQWRLHPAGLPPREGWTRHDRAIRLISPIGGSSYLFATVDIGDTALRCALDTGSPTPIRLFAEGVKAVGLQDWRARNWSPGTRRGKAMLPIVRLAKPLAIGAMKMERPLVTLDMETHDSLFGSALVGLPLIRRLDLATQVKDAVLWTRPNGGAYSEPSYNMSGIWVDREGSKLSIGAVGKGSPAEKAGLKVGDVIGGPPFQPLIAALNGPAGSSATFAVEGRTVTLTLEDYL